MNHSLHSADRTTHLKIVVVALIGALLVTGIGITARVSAPGNGSQIEARIPVIKAGEPMTISSNSEFRAVH